MNTMSMAVAGARKTQSIVDACAGGELGPQRLVLTYTLTGQSELSSRLAQHCGPGESPDVMGWYSFLLRHWIRPYLPLMYPGHRMHGLNFEGDPGRYATGASRFLDGEDRVYKLLLSKLAFDVGRSSKGAVLDRLQRIYDEIYIDEVQDLTGYDLEILTQLMKTNIDIHMVGDIRQSVFDTNPRDPMNRKYRGVKMLDWVRLHEKSGLMTLEHLNKTWRSNQVIATFSDSVFPASFGFAPTESMQSIVTGHDGVFAVESAEADAYVVQYSPLCLRDSKTTAASVDLAFMNFGKVKGMTVDRVLIYPTKTTVAFLAKGTELAPKMACGLYVATTRARHSVAFVVDKPDALHLERWKPTAG